MAKIKFDAPDYLQLLKGGTRYRMMRLNDRMTVHNPHRPPSMQWPTWREARQYGFHNWADSHGALAQGFNTEERWSLGKMTEHKTPVWYCHTGEQFRNEKDAHEVEGVRMDHTGWYADPDGNTLYIAIVGQLTHGRHISGYRDSNSGERVYFAKVFDDEKDAARHGDSIAERLAETECGHQEKRIEAQELSEEIKDTGRNVDMAFKLRHTDGYDDASSYRELEENIAELRKMKERMDAEYSEFKGEF